MARNDTVAVVIPTRDSARTHAIVAACAAVGIAEIIIVHPGEPVDLAPARSIATGELVRPAHARNRGASETSAAVICFIDDDVLLDAHSIPLLAHTCAQAGVVACAPWLIDAPQDGYWRRCMHRVMQAGHVDRSDSHVSDAFTSMCLCVRRSVFLAVGGFAERFPRPAGEDSAFVRAISAHGSVIRSSRETMTHQPSPDGWWPATLRLFRYGRYWPAVNPTSRAALWSRRAQCPLIWLLLALVSMWLAGYDVCATVAVRYWPGAWWLRWCWYLGVLSAERMEGRT